MNRVIEDHRNALLAAGDDPIKIITANKEFWGKKHEYIGLKEGSPGMLLFTSKRLSSYHPWSAEAMGEVYGELELKEFISPKDYLDSPVTIDRFLHGVARGAETAAKRKKEAADKAERDARVKSGKTGKGLADQLTKK